MMRDVLSSKLYKEDILRAINMCDLAGMFNSSILITGGSGLIGSAIIDVLIMYNQIQNANIKIYVASRNIDIYKQKYEKYDNVEYVKYDALDELKIDFRIDYIIHSAGLASPELYTSKPVETMLTNINGILNLLKYSHENLVKRLIYISSSEVYGNKNSLEAFSENMYGTIDLDSIRMSYAEAKRSSEMLCKAFASEFNVDTVIMRPGHIFGPTASINDKRISSEFAFLSAQGKSLNMKSAGTQKRSYCYSIDCAMAILLALLKGKKSEAYNVGHTEITTIKEMATILAEAGNVKLEVVSPKESEVKAFNPMDNASLNIDKLKALGYENSFSVREGLMHTVKILKEIYYND